MKIALIIIVLVVIIIVAFLFLYRVDDTMVLIGTMKDLESSIEKMMLSSKKDSFVIATVHGTDDFIQFSGNTKNVQLDFPQITDRQKSMEVEFRTVAKEMNLNVVENRGSGGELFLDIDLKGTPTEISSIARTFMERFFGLSQDTKVEYKLNI
jgi:hypothetical protein